MVRLYVREGTPKNSLEKRVMRGAMKKITNALILLYPDEFPDDRLIGYPFKDKGVNVEECRADLYATLPNNVNDIEISITIIHNILTLIIMRVEQKASIFRYKIDFDNHETGFYANLKPIEEFEYKGE